MPVHERKIAFIGGGHITEIIVNSILNSGTISNDYLIVSDPNGSQLEYLRNKFHLKITPDNLEAVQWADFVFINVLPETVDEVISGFTDPRLWNEKIIVSVAAGITMDRYAAIAGRLPVVRALPNPPSQIGKGIIALAINPYVNNRQKEEIVELFSTMGEYVFLDEKLINAMTSLSTPVTVYKFIQALIEAGVKAGMDNETSTKIVFQTIAGSVEVWKRNINGLNKLITQAATPGGISEECLLRLNKPGFHEAVIEAVLNGTKKADYFSRKNPDK